MRHTHTALGTMRQYRTAVIAPKGRSSAIPLTRSEQGCRTPIPSALSSKAGAYFEVGGTDTITAGFPLAAHTIRIATGPARRITHPVRHFQVGPPTRSARQRGQLPADSFSFLRLDGKSAP